MANQSLNNQKPPQAKTPKEIDLHFNETDTGAAKDNSPSIFDLWDMVDTVSVAPTWTPKKFSQQFVVYKNGATIRLYVYDAVNGAWRYTALT